MINRPEAWVISILILNIILCLVVGISQCRQSRRIWRIEHKTTGLTDRVINAYIKIDAVGRRVTGEFSGNEENTQLRRAMKHLKKSEYDDE